MTLKSALLSKELKAEVEKSVRGYFAPVTVIAGAIIRQSRGKRAKQDVNTRRERKAKRAALAATLEKESIHTL